jgi:zinc transport system ATP-binding protein
METILSVKNLKVNYQNHEVLKNISFDIYKGDYTAIAGPNGAGKTTLIKALLGINEKEEGTVKFNTGKIAYLQQKIALSDSKFPASVKEIIRSGLLVNKTFPRFFTKEDESRVQYQLEKLDIKKLENKLIGKLSGGELQKVLLARALISSPEIIFLDEPATALDPSSRENFYELLKELNKNEHITIILISHDIGSIGRYAEKLMYLDGAVIFYGTFQQFCESSDMTLYFGSRSQHLFCQRHN